MLFVLGETNSIAHQFLLELRDKERQQDRLRFRLNLERLGELMAYEISKKLSYRERQVQTTLGTTKAKVLPHNPVLITIMRAGLPYHQGFQNIFDQSDSGFVGAFREETREEISIQLAYLATPAIEGKDVILIDPMLATEKSVTDTIGKLLLQGKPNHIYLASVIASPEGIRHVSQEIKVPFSIWTFAVDEKLNQQFFIMPGLGDAGDLSFGEKL